MTAEKKEFRVTLPDDLNEKLRVFAERHGLKIPSAGRFLLFSKLHELETKNQNGDETSHANTQ